MIKIVIETKTLAEAIAEMRAIIGEHAGSTPVPVAANITAQPQSPEPPSPEPQSLSIMDNGAPSEATASTLEQEKSAKPSKTAAARAAKAAKAAAAKAAKVEPEPEPEDEAEDEADEADAPEALTPAALAALHAKTVAALQTAYANGLQKEVFALLAKYGNGAKSFRELSADAFVPISKAIEAGALEA